ncbi:MAG: hypothetical protein AAF438_20240 [Pseudomonadota bacterium]
MKGPVFAVAFFALGLAVGWWIYHQEQTTPHRAPVDVLQTPVIEDELPRISAQEAQDHRDNFYQDLETMSDVVSLPTDFAETEALYAVAGRANAEELQVLIQQAMAMANRYDRRAALQILYGRYADLDAEGALDFLDESRLDIDTQIIGGMFYSLAKSDLNLAVDLANDYNNVRRRKLAGQSILKAIGEISPDNLERVASALKDHYIVDNYRTSVLATLANTDPYSAMEQALSLTTTRSKYGSMQRIAEVWARTDPEAALAYAANIGNASIRSVYLNGVLQRWVSDDPDGAVNTLMNLPSGELKDRAIDAGLQSLAMSAPEQAMVLVEQLEPFRRAKAYQSIFSGWAQADPRSAAMAVLGLPGEHLNLEILGFVAHQFATQNPEEALAWAEQLPVNQRVSVINQVVNGIAQNDPRAALSYVTSMGGTAGRQGLRQVMGNIAMAEPSVAAEYVTALAEGAERDQLISQIASHWSMRDPEGAINWVMSLGAHQNEAIMREVGSMLASRSPDLAARYLDQTKGALRNQWITQIAAGYARRDPDRALAWLEQYKNQPVYATALSRFIPQIAHRDPQRALSIIERAGTQSPQMISMVVSQWSESDLEGARRWLQNSSPEIQEAGAGSLVQSWARFDYNGASTWAAHYLLLVDDPPS